MSLTSAQLPVRLTPLVGRESELDDIVQALTRCRLLTLTGPGGAGKTRLALAAARSASTSFPAGVCWVELAQIEDPGLVGQAVATRLGVPDTPGQDAAQAVAEYVGEHRVLVVLDNCEHLAGTTAGLTEDLLAACPALTVLATSREALGVEGELSWQVPPLSLPHAGPALTASALASSDAVKLFEQRAQLVRPSFRVTDENAAEVARSASGWTDCRWPSNWRRPGCGCCPARSWRSGWTTSSPSWSAARGRRPRGTRPCAPPWTGATTCSTTMSGPCSGGWPCSPAVSRWRRPSGWRREVTSSPRPCWSC
jgi:hypothetical protein